MSAGHFALGLRSYLLGFHKARLRGLVTGGFLLALASHGGTFSEVLRGMLVPCTWGVWLVRALTLSSDVCEQSCNTQKQLEMWELERNLLCHVEEQVSCHFGGEKLDLIISR